MDLGVVVGYLYYLSGNLRPKRKSTGQAGVDPVLCTPYMVTAYQMTKTSLLSDWNTVSPLP